jgi:polysaccharide biosynthesis/export protein
MPATRRNYFASLRLLPWRIAVGVLALLLGACQSAPPQAIPASAAPRPALAEQVYRVGPGDELDIRFFHNPELDQQLPVRPDGRLALLLVGELEVAGLSVPELRETLVERYGEHLKLPEIAVAVKGFAAQQVYVGGEVGQPAVLPLTPGMTVRQAITQSGGALTTARLGNVLVLRDQGTSKPQVFAVDLHYGIGHENIGEDLVLAPKDVVFVPKTYIAEVNQFVDEYIGRIVPRWLMFQFTYNVGGIRLE